MKLVIAFLLSMVVLGLVTERFDTRIYVAAAGASTLMTALFFVFVRFWL